MNSQKENTCPIQVYRKLIHRLVEESRDQDFMRKIYSLLDIHLEKERQQE